MFILKMLYRKFDGHTIYHFRIKKLTVIKKMKSLTIWGVLIANVDTCFSLTRF